MHPPSPLSRRAFLAASATGVAALGTATTRAAVLPQILVLISGKPSHGPLEHEFNAGISILKKILAKNPSVALKHVTGGWPEDEKVLQNADGILLYADGGGGHPFVQPKRLEMIGDFMKRGVGLMCMHYAVEVPKDKGGPQFQDWIGGYYEHMWSVNPMWTPEFTEFPKHEITRGVKPFAVRDEWYFNMRFRPEMKGITPILSAKPSDAVRDGPYVYPKGPYPHIQQAKGQVETMMWAVDRPDGGRGVGFTGGHFHKNWQDDNFRKIVLNAALWVCKAPIPPEGMESKVTEKDMKENLDPKGPKNCSGTGDGSPGVARCYPDTTVASDRGSGTTTQRPSIFRSPSSSVTAGS